MLLVLATVRCCTMLLFGTVYMFDFQCWACDFVEIAEIDNLQYTLPALERTCWPSSRREKEQTKTELECDILAPSPEILIFTVGGSSTSIWFDVISCKIGHVNITQCYRFQNSAFLVSTVAIYSISHFLLTCSCIFCLSKSSSGNSAPGCMVTWGFTYAPCFIQCGLTTFHQVWSGQCLVLLGKLMISFPWNGKLILDEQDCSDFFFVTFRQPHAFICTLFLGDWDKKK